MGKVSDARGAIRVVTVRVRPASMGVGLIEGTKRNKKEK